MTTSDTAACSCCRCRTAPYDDGVRVPITITKDSRDTIRAGGEWRIQITYEVDESYTNLDGSTGRQEGTYNGELVVEHTGCSSGEFFSGLNLSTTLTFQNPGEDPTTSSGSLSFNADFRFSIGRTAPGSYQLKVHARFGENVINYSGASANGYGNIVGATITPPGTTITILDGYTSGFQGSPGYTCSNALTLSIVFHSDPP